MQFNPNPKHQSINMNVYGRVTAWLRRNPSRATASEARWGSDLAGKGGRTLCLTAPTSGDTAALYDDVRKLLPKYSPKGRIILQSRLGYRFQTELSSYSPGERVPKDNGLRQRPPTDKWN